MQITPDKIREAAAAGYSVEIIINGEYYELSEEPTKGEKETMTDNERNAATIAEALTNFKENPEAIETFFFYLEKHFDKWLKSYASTPEGLAAELLNFSKMN